MTIYGSGFRPGESTNLFLVTDSTDGAPVQSPIGSALANSRGAIQAEVQIEAYVPAEGDTAASGIEPGLYAVKAAGIRGTEATAPLVVGSADDPAACK